MRFADQQIRVSIDGKAVNVTVSGKALYVLWGAGTGPQDGPGLVAANRDYIGRLVSDRIAEGDGPGDVVVSEMDIEG